MVLTAYANKWSPNSSALRSLWCCMILTHTNKHCPRHCLIMGQAIRKRKNFTRRMRMRGTLLGRVTFYGIPSNHSCLVWKLWIYNNLYILHLGILKELTQPSLRHYNYFKITFETVIQILGTHTQWCVTTSKRVNKQIQVITGLSIQHWSSAK